MTTSLQSRQRKKSFLAAFAEVGNITRAAEIAGITRQAVYEWKEADPVFLAAMADAELEAAERLETEARRRAVEGLIRKKFGAKGEPLIDEETGAQYFEREYSDTLLIFLMKGANPGKYRENRGTEVNIDNRTQVQADNVILQIIQARQAVREGQG